MLYQKLLSVHTQLEHEISSIQTQLKVLPPGTLTIAKNKSQYKWYVTDGKTSHYLPKSEKFQAEVLARKKYLSFRLEELISERDALFSYLRRHSKSHDKSEKLLQNPSYFQLLKSHFQPTSQKLKEWTEASYEKNSSYPEHLIHRSISSNFVRSKSEAMIDSALFRNHIPFRYECLLSLSDTILYPDFTILHPDTGRLWYWEHFGMMDDASYARNAYIKLQLYQANQIIPSINLITTYETKNNPLCIDFIEKLIHLYFD